MAESSGDLTNRLNLEFYAFRYSYIITPGVVYETLRQFIVHLDTIEDQHMGRSCASMRPRHSCLHAHQMDIQVQRAAKTLNQSDSPV